MFPYLESFPGITQPVKRHISCKDGSFYTKDFCPDYFFSNGNDSGLHNTVFVDFILSGRVLIKIENLKNCRVHGKYAGTVEDIHKGTVFVRLELGVNAIAHSCYDSRTVGKKDKVSFVVTILMKNGMLLLASLQGLSNKISDYQKQYEKELTTSISYCDTRYSMLY